MTAMAQGRPMAYRYLPVKCPCGRDLRARAELAGSLIHCWDCHASVPVPVPVAPGGWVARLLGMTAKQILEARTVTLLSIGAVLVTLALAMTSLGVPMGAKVRAWMPYPGVWAAAIALGLVMVGYGELLRRGSQGDWTARPPVSPMARVWRALICLGAGVALIMPLILATAAQTPPRLTPAGLGIALAATLAFPLVMLGTYFPRGSVIERVALVGSMLKRHPMALLASLLLLPLSLLAIEVAVIVLMRLTSTLAFLLLDLFPAHDWIRIHLGIPYYAPGELRNTWVDFREFDTLTVLALYTDSLWHGYSLLGTIPASLAMDMSHGYHLDTIGLNPRGYLAFRMFFTLVIVTGMLSVLAVQARWLGLLSTMDSRRSAASPGSIGRAALPNLSPEKS